MSKLLASLNYKDWCILKHTLDRSVKDKEQKLFADSLGSWPSMTAEEKQKIEKELEEEKRTLKRVTEKTDSFKRYINGARFYE